MQYELAPLKACAEHRSVFTDCCTQCASHYGYRIWYDYSFNDALYDWVDSKLGEETE